MTWTEHIVVVLLADDDVVVDVDDDIDDIMVPVAVAGVIFDND